MTDYSTQLWNNAGEVRQLATIAAFSVLMLGLLIPLAVSLFKRKSRVESSTTDDHSIKTDQSNSSINHMGSGSLNVNQRDPMDAELLVFLKRQVETAEQKAQEKGFCLKH